VDWKPKREIQAKVRDFKKKKGKKKIKWPFEAWIWKGTLGQFRNGDFCQASDYWALPQQWLIFGLNSISGLFRGLHPDSVWLISSDVIPIEDYWVLVLWCRATSFWTCPILSQQSYHYSILWVSYIFIHSCIHSMHTDTIHTWLHYQSYFKLYRKCHPQYVWFI